LDKYQKPGSATLNKSKYYKDVDKVGSKKLKELHICLKKCGRYTGKANVIPN
jgi:hypothetical protein